MSATLQKLQASIEAQQKKLAQLKERKAKAEARQRSIANGQARRQDTRRKVLAGAMILEMMASDDDVKNRVMARLDAFLKRADDRALFGLSGGTTKKSEEKNE